MTYTYEESLAFVVEETIENAKRLYAEGAIDFNEFEEIIEEHLDLLDKGLSKL